MELVLPDSVNLKYQEEESFIGRFIPGECDTEMIRIVDNDINGITLYVKGEKLPRFYEFNNNVTVKPLRFKIVKNSPIYQNKKKQIEFKVNDRTTAKGETIFKV